MIPRKFGVRYNPYTLSVEILDNTNQMAQYAGDIKGITTESNIIRL